MATFNALCCVQSECPEPVLSALNGEHPFWCIAISECIIKRNLLHMLNLSLAHQREPSQSRSRGPRAYHITAHTNTHLSRSGAAYMSTNADKSSEGVYSGGNAQRRPS